jgi:hypothetical protein
MSPVRHGIIRIETTGREGADVTVRVRCACGKWRQAGSFPDYPGEAGAILLAARRSDCEPGDLGDYRVRWPFPADPASMERAAGTLDRKSTQLRAEAARLVRMAEEYESGAARIRGDLPAVSAEAPP